MALNSAEYRTLQHHTNDLGRAVKEDLGDLSGALFAAGLITKLNRDEVTYMMHLKEERAAKLVGFVQDKVAENPQNYHTFISLLRQRDPSKYRDILWEVEHTYKSMSLLCRTSRLSSCEAHLGMRILRGLRATVRI